MIHIGTILKPHSYLGKFKMAVFVSEYQDALEPDSFIFVELDGKPVPYLIEEYSTTGAESGILKVADINTEGDAKKLQGNELYVLTESVAEQDEEDPSYYGYEVRTEEDLLIGTVEDIIENPLQSLLVVHDSVGKEFLIPIHEDIIMSIDTEAELIIVDLPEGFLEI